MPDTTAPGASGQVAPSSSTANPSAGTGPGAATQAAPSQAASTQAAESTRRETLLKSAREFVAKRGGTGGEGGRESTQAGTGTTGTAAGDQKPASPGRPPTHPQDPAAAAGDDKKPHPNSTEAKAAKKLADDLADARHVLRRSGKDMAEVDKLTDGGILMLAEQQRAIDRLAGEKGSQRKDADPRTPRPADPAARSTKGTGEGSDDLLPPDPADDDPLADPSPKPQTAGLPASRSVTPVRVAATSPAARNVKSDIMTTRSHHDQFSERPHRLSGKSLGHRNPAATGSTRPAIATAHRPAGEFLENISLIYLPS